MGLLDSIFGRGKTHHSNAKSVEDRLRVDYLEVGLSKKDEKSVKALVDKISVELGEEFKLNNFGGRECYLSKSKVIGFFWDTKSMKHESKLSIVKRDELKQMDDLIGLEGGTQVNASIFDKIIGVLESEGIDYSILINKIEDAPITILSKEGKIIIAPVLQTG